MLERKPVMEVWGGVPSGVLGWAEPLVGSPPETESLLSILYKKGQKLKI